MNFRKLLTLAVSAAMLLSACLIPAGAADGDYFGALTDDNVLDDVPEWCGSVVNPLVNSFSEQYGLLEETPAA